MKMQNFDEAVNDIKSAIKLAPQDKNLRAIYEEIKAEKKKNNTSQQEAMKKFFAEGVYNEKEVKVSPTVHQKLPDFDPENVQTYFDV